MEEQQPAARPASARRRRVGMERCLLCVTVVLFSSSLGLGLALTQVVGSVQPAPPDNSSTSGAANTSTATEDGRHTDAAAVSAAQTAARGRSRREMPTVR